MPGFDFIPAQLTWGSPTAPMGRWGGPTDQLGDKPLEARVKRECAALYPGVDPRIWYQVLMNGEYKDDLEGFWIQVEEWVTYVLVKHFDVQARPVLH